MLRWSANFNLFVISAANNASQSSNHGPEHVLGGAILDFKQIRLTTALPYTSMHLKYTHAPPQISNLSQNASCCTLLTWLILFSFQCSVPWCAEVNLNIPTTFLEDVMEVSFHSVFRCHTSLSKTLHLMMISRIFQLKWLFANSAVWTLVHHVSKDI